VRKRHLTSIEFEAVKCLLFGIKPERIELARLVLVEGLSMAEAGRINSTPSSRQSVLTAVEQAWKMWTRFEEARFMLLAREPWEMK
jgi:hypothetical protein